MFVKKVFDTYENLNRIPKIIMFGIIMIVLGALGSGLWDLFLSHIIDICANFVLTTLSKLFKGYVDILYYDVGKGPYFSMLNVVFSLAMGIVITLPILVWLSARRAIKIMNKKLDELDRTSSSNKNNEDKLLDENMSELKNRILKLNKFGNYVVFPLMLISTLVYASQGIESVYSNKASIYIERSIEILRPHIDENTLIELRAQYRNIDNARAFYDLYDLLNKMASDNNVMLPQFTVIR